MKHLLYILAIIMLICCYPSAAQHVMILKPHGTMGTSALLWSNHPDSNMVGWQEIKVNAWTWDGIAGINRSLIKFNLNLLPANSTVLSAKLSLFGNYGSPENNSTLSGSNQCLIQRVTTYWDPTIVTWNMQPETDTVHQVRLSHSTSEYEDYINIDVTTLIRDLYSDPGAYRGLMLKLDTESYFRRLVFKSCYQPDSAKSPMLTISYSVLGLDDLSSKNYFSINPNPATNKFIVTRISGQYAAIIEIYNILGEKIHSEKLSSGQKQKEITLPEARSGTYFVKVVDGGNQYSSKLIIR